MTTTVTCIAPVNIAVIKYWGKRDEELIIPINDSISTTLNLEHMCAKTTITASPDFKKNQFFLNGIEQSFDNNPRLNNCLKQVKARAQSSEPALLTWCIRIDSNNNFPTGAGLASSAAGFACLVRALSALYGISGELSTIARLGSGSACRSMYGGFVQWHSGSGASDASDSLAIQLADASHWPQLRVVILVVSDARKKDSSTGGMQRSVATSTLLAHRRDVVVPMRVTQMRDAIMRRDFNAFAALTMQDSNQFHAICADTFPPCFYMNDVSRAIVEFVHCYNEYRKLKTKHGAESTVAYTFDAGPNACLYVLDENLGELLAFINEYFPPIESGDHTSSYWKGLKVEVPTLTLELSNALSVPKQKPGGALKYIICTNVGDGPKIL